MGKTSSSRTGRADSEVSSRTERRRTQDELEESASSRRRSQAESVTSSNSKRRSHRRDEERDVQDTSRPYRQSSQEYTGANVPYGQNGAGDVDSADRTRRSEPDQTYRSSRREERRDSLKSSGRSERGSTRALDDESVDRRDGTERRDSERSRRRDSKRDSTSARRSDRDERSRALGDHDASLPQNQFPGSFPDTNSLPYGPPGQAADYYGDQGESVQYQPGVRPQGPAFVTSAEQAHLHEPTVESAPPPEPSSLGQVGAAASYFASGDSDNNAPQQPNPSRPNVYTSPKANPTRPGSMTSNGQSIAASTAAAGLAAGMAAQSYATDDAHSSSHSYQNSSSFTSYHTPSQYSGYPGDTYSQSSPGNPGKLSGSSANYAGMAAAGLAGAAAAGYYAHQHQHHDHEHEHQHEQGSTPAFVVGQGQSAFPGMQQQLRRKNRGPLTKLANWFRDPDGVSQFERYSEVTGVCKYCFDPNSSAADAPRKHYYHKPRPQPQYGRFGAANRVEKPYRHSASSSSSSSNDDDGKKKRKRSSTTKKVLAGGVAAYGAAKVGEAVFNQQNNFDDTYSVKSGRPLPSNTSQTTVYRVDYEDADMYGSGSRRRNSKGSRSYVSEDVDLRRKDSNSSRKSRRDEEVYSDRKRSSKRRGSSSSSGRSRGAAAALGAVAGVAGVAALASSGRRRSRSRSRERSSKLGRKRSYYSKRISPRHSYVDLSTKTSGAVGFGQFFSSPSANDRKGRKKGFFTWNNDSSSSSDADLAFGEGTVRRKSSKYDRTRKDSSGKVDDTAAILGLAATGAALAAEVDKRKSKSRYATDDVYTGHGTRRLSTNKIRLQDKSYGAGVDGDDVWEDASDDDMSSDSVDTALAYGGRLSNRNSRESLAEQGTSKWAWRWTPNREKQASKERRKDQSYYPQTPPHRDAYDMASTGVAAAVGAGVGAATANLIKSSQANVVAATPSPLPPMQFVEPFAASDPNLYEAERVSRIEGTSPHTFVSRSPAPLQQPQAVNAPSIAPIPVVLDKLEKDAQLTDSPTEMGFKGQSTKDRRTRTESVERTRTKRRNSSPPVANPSNISRNSVSWDLTDEQLENEKRALDKQEKRRKRRGEEDRRRSADFSTPDRKPPQDERSSDSRKDSLERHEDRRSEIDRELQALYAEHKRQMEEQKMLYEYRRNHGESGGIAAAIVGAGVGAAASAMINESKKSSGSDSDKKPRRKSSLKKNSADISTVQSPVREPSPPRESQQERIAKMSTLRKQDSSSPGHDDYAAFFLPEDVAEHVKEHNDAAEKRERDREVIDFITPEMLSAGRKPYFDSWLYSPYRPGRPHQANYHPRGVPILELIEATPPGSPGGGRLVSNSSPLAQTPIDTEDIDVTEEPLDGAAASSSASSKVTWGDNSRHVYEVETPEYERNDPTAELAKVRTVSGEEVERIEREDRKVKRQRDHRPGRDISDIEQPVYEDRSADPSPMIERDQEALLGDKSYQTPFYESVSDIGEPLIGDEQHRNVPKTGPGFAVPLPDSPAEEKIQTRRSDKSDNSSVPHDGEAVADDVGADARPSRIERRRLERAMSSSETITPVIQTPPPEPKSVEPIHQQEVQPDATKQMPGGFEVFDYLVDDEGKPMPPDASREIEATVLSSLSRQRAGESSATKVQTKSKDADEVQFSKPKRAATFGDTQISKTAPKSGTEYASDPEDWERSTKKSKKDKSSKSRSEVGISSRDAFAAVAAGAAAAAAARALKQDSGNSVKETASTAEAEPDFYASSSKDKKKRRSKRESEIFEDYDNKSVVSLPATKDEDRKSRRRSKRDSEIFDDDDSKSVTSMPATKDEDSKSKRRSRDKEKEPEKEKRSSGIFGGIFSSNKSDVSASSKKSSRSGKSESRSNRDEDVDRERRRKRRSKSVDDYEDPISIASNGATKSDRRRTDSPEQEDSAASVTRDIQGPGDDDGFVSADDGHASRDKANKYDDENQSFLARGLEMPQPTVTSTPMVTDGVSGQTLSEGQTSEKGSIEGKARDLVDDLGLPPLPRQDELEAAALAANPTLSSTPSTERMKQLSTLRTQNGDSAPMIMSSPTAVPLPFGRRGPFTPGSVPRSVGSPSHASSPFTTPRTRMNRPKSTSGKDFKPLYLVERHSYQKTGTPETEETFPSLPSSRASSANPSMEDLRGNAGLQIDASAFGERGRRHSFSSVEDRAERRQSPDYLDSRAATPVPGDKQKAREREMLEIRERKEKENQWKSLFHSPSELLQDPSLNREVVDENVDVERVGSPLPSVVSTDQDLDFMSAESRAESPVRGSEVPPKRPSRPGSSSREQQAEISSISPEQRSRSASTSKPLATLTGLGIAGGMVAALQSRDHDNEEKDSSGEAISPVDPAVQNANEGFSEPASSKKSKKEKKKKRKTLELTSGNWDEDLITEAAQEPTVTQSETWQEISQKPPASALLSNESQEQIVSSTKSQKDKKKGKGGRTSNNSLPTIDTAAAQSTDVPHLDDPPTAVPALDHDADLLSSQTAKASEDKSATLERAVEDSEILNSSARAGLIVEGSIEKDVQSMTTESGFVPTIAQMNQPHNQLGAFEEAFERAVRARGLKTGISREGALEAFLPTRDNAPFVPRPDLTPVPEGSPASTSTPVEDVKQRGFDQAVEDVIQKKLSKKEKRKSKKSSLSNPETPDEPYEPLSMKNPFGDDFDIKSETPAETSDRSILREQEEPLQRKPVEENPDEFFSVPSKKDKKKKRKSKTQTDLSDVTADQETDLPVTASSVEASREVAESSTPADEVWDDTTTKKGKKSKKSRAKFDWTDIAAIAAAGATASAVATETLAGHDAENTRDIPATIDEKQKQAEAVTDVRHSASDFVDDPVSKPDQTSEHHVDEWAETTGRKSKKDKKKKNKASALGDLDEVPVATSGPSSMALLDGNGLTAIEDDSRVLVPKSKDEGRSDQETIDRSVQDSSTAIQTSSAPTESEDQPLPRKLSKKEKRKNKQALALTWDDEPSKPSTTTRAPDETLNSDELRQDTVEAQKDDIAKSQLADEIAIEREATPAEDKPQSSRQIQPAQPLPAASASRVPPNPFAVNLSMADAIALSMGQNIAALSAAKPAAKKKKAVAGQGPSWTSWTPALSGNDNQETSDSKLSQEPSVSHEEREDVRRTEPGPSAETKEAERAKWDTLPGESLEQTEAQNIASNVQATPRNLEEFGPDANIDDFEPVKNPKKDKKKNRKSVAEDAEESDSIFPGGVNDRDSLIVDSEPFPLTKEPVATENVDTLVQKAEARTDEQEIEDPLSFATKKSKKEKKKRRSLAAGLEVSEPDASGNEPGAATSIKSKEMLSEKPRVVDKTDAQLGSETQTPEESETGDIWSYSTKKDKKKKRKSKLDVTDTVIPSEDAETLPVKGSLPADDLPPAEPVDSPRVSNEVHEAKAVEVPNPVPAEDEWTVPVKLSKKDKKKRKSVVATEEPGQTVEQEKSAPEEEVTLTKSTELPSNVDESATPAMAMIAAAAVAAARSDSHSADTTDTPEESEWSMPIKPSKKDKKKKRKSVVSLDPAPEIETTSAEVSGKELESETVPSRFAIDKSAQPAQVEATESLTESTVMAQAPTEATMEDEWSFSTKPTKKDKKKRKSGTVTSIESEAEVVIDKKLSLDRSEEAANEPIVLEEPVSVEAPSLIQDTPVPASLDATEDEWAHNRKLSKKDRKKAQKAQEQDRDLSESTGPSLLPEVVITENEDHPSEAKPPVKKDIDELTDKIAAIKDRSAHELHSHDTHAAWLSQVHHSSSIFPSKSADVDVSRDERSESGTTRAEPTDVIPESMSEVFDTPAETEPDQEFAFTSAKKSKKDKKKNKRKSIGTAEEATEKAIFATAAGATAVTAATVSQDEAESTVKEVAHLQHDAEVESEAQKDPEAIFQKKGSSMPGAFGDTENTPEGTQGESEFASATATPIETSTKEPEDFSWTSAFKKNKKDKKKRKSVAWSDADTSTPGTPVNEQISNLPPVVTGDASRNFEAPTDIIDVVREVPEDPAITTSPLAITVDDPTIPDLPTPGVEKEDYEWPIASKKKGKKDKKTRSSVSEPQEQMRDDAGDDVKLAQPAQNAFSETELFQEPLQDAPEAAPADVQESAEVIPEEWTQLSSSKKKKKDKKKKRGSPAYDWDQPSSDNKLPDEAEANVNVEESPDKMVVDEVVPSTHHTDASTKGLDENSSARLRNLSGEDQLHESLVAKEPSFEVNDGTTREVSATGDMGESIEPGEWALPGKMSKKDKKKKKKEQLNAEKEESDVAQATAVAGAAIAADTIAATTSHDIPTDQSKVVEVKPERDMVDPTSESDTRPLASMTVSSSESREAVKEADEWAFDTKKSKKDKKKKKRQSRTDDDNEEDNLASRGSKEQGEDALPTDTGSRIISPPEIEVPATLATTDPPTTAEAEHPSIPEPHVEDEWASTSKKTKKDKKKRKSTADESKEIGATSPEGMSLKSKELPNYVRDFSASHLHEAPRHQEYLSAAQSIASDFPVKPSGPKGMNMADNLERDHLRHEDLPSKMEIEFELAQDSDAGSNVSDETRERRKRRRSPPLTRDHDPEDLPTNRSLTPPPEHDDLMDTALTIAAGLGFGESQPTVSDPTKSHSERSVPSLENPRSDQKLQSEDYNRDSGVLFESPEMMQDALGTVRDSGYVPSPPMADSWSRGLGVEGSPDVSRRPTRPQSPTSSMEDLGSEWHDSSLVPETTSGDPSFTTPARRQPLPVDSASKERSSVVFNSSPAAGSTPSKTPGSDQKNTPRLKELRIPTSGHHRTASIPEAKQHSRTNSMEASEHVTTRQDPVEQTLLKNNRPSVDLSPSRRSIDRPGSPSKQSLQTIHESMSPGDIVALGPAALGLGAIAATIDSRDHYDPSQTKSLGTSNPGTDSERGRASTRNNSRSKEDAVGTARGMSENDVYDGYGSFPGSPRSPTRPPSVRKRQSMQQIKDLEVRVDQLANENRSLAEAKLIAERHLEEFQTLGASGAGADSEALQSANEQLQERDRELTKLRAEITALAAAHATLKTSHDEKHAQLETSSRELGGLRSKHEELSSGMDEVVKHEIAAALAEKNAELQRLRLDLENARLKIRELQSQILARGADEIVIIRDEDYFETACQNLCQHVQGWVVRFSKFSDTRVCRSMSEVRDVKVLDRFDNALLDGSDIDPYLADRVKRRDVFMSVVMTMIWEYVFTRYLFGMDRDQRQKLKQLEKNLTEVGPAHAVHQWRALTLTLLSKRDAFRAQCDNDTEAVVVEVMKALSRFLPPPQNLEAQITESLRKVMKVAVELAIEMRTQKAEYIMLPPLQPEYDTQGDLTQKVYFNANLMNERSGEFESNEQLEESKAVVRIVLFPLVVKKGDDDGRGDAEFVVCPAQVLVARADKGKRPKSRIASAGSASDMRSLRAASTHSLAMSGVDMTGAGNMI